MLMLRFDSEKLKRVMRSVLDVLRVDADASLHLCESLIETSLRGIDSHGINLFPHYCSVINSGRVHKAPNMAFERTSASTGVLNADHAFGHYSGVVAMDQAIILAKESGCGVVSVKDSSHFGAAAYFGLRGARQGYLTFSFTNGDSLVKAFGSPEIFFGTNPICFCAPLEKEDPLCLDMATSTITWNKLREKRERGESIPADWGFNSEGQPTTDPSAVVCLAPLGGYKGFGLSMLVEILCALLSNNPAARELAPMFSDSLNERYVSHFFLVLRIDAFTSPQMFLMRLQNLVDQIRNLPKLPQILQVMVPGDPEKIQIEIRRKEGIPVTEQKFQEFLKLSVQFDECTIA